MQIPRLLANVFTLLALLALSVPAHARQNAGFRFVEGDGWRDLYFGDKAVYRYIAPKHDPANHDATLKPFVHVYGFNGEGFITKGAGGMETHHRGIFLGFNTQLGNFWACKDCWQQHVKYLDERKSVSADSARLAAVTEWITKDGKPVVRDTREVAARQIAPGRIQLDFDVTLESLAGEVDLGGDPHHGGFHFRAAEEVQGPATTKPSIRAGLATYIRPPEAKLDKDDKWLDTNWAACLFSIKGNPYVVVEMNDPSNPKPVTFSTRPYGRFGVFFTYKLVEGKPLRLRYRILILDGEQFPKPNAEAFAPMYAEFEAWAARP